MIKVIFLPQATKYLKKIKDKKLKSLFQGVIDKIQLDPFVGEAKSGDLYGVYCCEIRYNKTDYRLAYTLVEIEPNITVVVVLTGTHENFYEELKRYIQANNVKNISQTEI